MPTCLCAHGQAAHVRSHSKFSTQCSRTRKTQSQFYRGIHHGSRFMYKKPRQRLDSVRTGEQNQRRSRALPVATGKTPSLAASNANAPASTTTEADRSATQLLQRYYAPLCQKSLRFPCKSLATLTKSTACKTQRPARLRVSPTRDVQLTDLATESQIGHTSHPFNSVACKLLLFR